MIEIRNLLLETCALTPEIPIVVGVSGGADSLCLAHLLNREGFCLIVAHFNHQLRPEAGGEAEKVRQFAEQFNLRFEGGSGDVAVFAGQQKLSIEESARKMRYEFLFRVAENKGAQAVAVAHHADDQVETVLMHLLRGSGLAGLRGMRPTTLDHPWAVPLPLVRPLLGVWREEIEAYCLAEGLDPVQDSSNLDTRYYRNRLRHELLPELASYNPQVKQAFWRMADSLALDEEVLEDVVAQAMLGVQHGVGADWLRFGRRIFLELLPGVQQRLLREAIRRLQADLRDIDYLAIQRALAFLKTPSTSQRIELIANLELKIENDDFYILQQGAELPLEDYPQINEALRMEKPGEYVLANGWMAYLTLRDDLDLAQVKNNGSVFTCWLDAERVTFPLALRSYQPGERFSPLGMEGHSLKVSDYLINQKIPERARGSLPVLVQGETLLWLTQGPPAGAYAVTDATRQVLEIRLVPPESKSL